MRASHQLAAVFAVMLNMTAVGATINVPADESTIQAAIDAAGSGDEIVVAPGTYPEVIDLLGLDITLRSAAGPQVTIIDGTGLDDSVVRCVTGEAADTVISGFTITNGTGDTVDFPNAVGGGLYCKTTSPTVVACVFVGNTGGNGGAVFVVDGAPTFTNCIFNSNNATVSGGAVFNDASDPTFVNCTFEGNVSASIGGALLNEASDPVIANCILWDNLPNEIVSFSGSSPVVSYSDVRGGAIGTGNKNVDPAFVDAPGGDLRLTSASLVIDAGDNGAVPAGITTDVDGAPRFIDDPGVVDTGVPAAPLTDMGAYEFGRVLNSTRNVRYATIQLALDDASDGDQLLVEPGRHREILDFGGVDVILKSTDGADSTILDGSGFPDSVVKLTSGESAKAVLDGFTITGGSGNSEAVATPLGGGVYVDMSNPTILNCIFLRNEAFAGAGLYVSDGDPAVRRCVFEDNTGSNAGGGMYLVGSDARVSNCIFAGNFAPFGGALVCDVGAPAVSNSVFSGNSGVIGGALVAAAGSDMLLTNSSVAGNSAFTIGGAANVVGGGLEMVNCVVWDNTSPTDAINGSATIQYSDVQDVVPGVGNISSDPMFADPLGADGLLGTRDDDLELASGSPCIDAGTNAVVEVCVFDLLGHVRRFDDPATTPDTGMGTAPVVDMGAYEFGSTAGNDCNENALADGCEVDTTFISTSGPLIPFGMGFSGAYVITGAPFALGDVQLDFTASADLAETFELVNVLINDVSVGSVFEVGASACPAVPDQGKLIVPMAIYNGALAGELDAVIVMNPTDDVAVASCPSSYIQVEVTFLFQPPNDLDDNGIPDDCEVPAACPEDLDGNDSVGFADLNMLLGAWGVCPGCPEDLDGSGSVGFADLNALLSVWGPCV